MTLKLYAGMKADNERLVGQVIQPEKKANREKESVFELSPIEKARIQAKVTEVLVTV
jgi:hypothetical protein